MVFACYFKTMESFAYIARLVRSVKLSSETAPFPHVNVYNKNVNIFLQSLEKHIIQRMVRSIEWITA